ncbi:MAG TPA: hypothetical protein VHC39_03450 [Rhizomicrobium sp.]|nr:hypothetical protein [Rhizomicrobium sp.]
MDRINPHDLYTLGQQLQKVRITGDQDANNSTIFFDLFGAQNIIRQLIGGQPVPLGVSRGKAQELLNALTSLIDGIYYEKDEQGNKTFKYPSPGEKMIQSWNWDHLASSLDKFETVFAEEMRDNATYYVPRRGIFNTKALVDTADEAFPSGLHPFIPEKTREDWRAAGRCLAFNLLSASGFHVARAVEGTIESYYQKFCGQPAGSTLKGWHDYVQALEGARLNGSNPAPSDKTIAEIKQMKDDYRNPIAHPRLVLTEADARMLFANGESLIIGMAQELCEASKGVQPLLGLINMAPAGIAGAAE